MLVAMDKCMAKVRMRDARGDDVKATIIKEKKTKQKKIRLLYMEMFSRKNSI